MVLAGIESDPLIYVHFICIDTPGSPANPLSRVRASFLQNSTHNPQPLQLRLVKVSFFILLSFVLFKAPVGHMPVHSGQQSQSSFALREKRYDLKMSFSDILSSDIRDNAC